MNVEVFIADCQEVPVKIVVDPPNETDEPLIVIDEFANLLLAIEPASWAFVIVPDNDDVGFYFWWM